MPNYDSDDEAWPVDDIGELQVELPEVHTNSSDNISQFSMDSITSQESKEPVFIAAGDIRYGQTTRPLLFHPSLRRHLSLCSLLFCQPIASCFSLLTLSLS